MCMGLLVILTLCVKKFAFYDVCHWITWSNGITLQHHYSNTSGSLSLVMLNVYATNYFCVQEHVSST